MESRQLSEDFFDSGHIEQHVIDKFEQEASDRGKSVSDSPM